MTALVPTAAKLLTDLRLAGVILTANRDRLAFDAPAGVMTPAVQAMCQRTALVPDDVAGVVAIIRAQTEDG